MSSHLGKGRGRGREGGGGGGGGLSGRRGRVNTPSRFMLKKSTGRRRPSNYWVLQIICCCSFTVKHKSKKKETLNFKFSHWNHSSLLVYRQKIFSPTSILSRASLDVLTWCSCLTCPFTILSSLGGIFLLVVPWSISLMSVLLLYLSLCLTGPTRGE